jgi:hypothetical protein
MKKYLSLNLRLKNNQTIKRSAANLSAINAPVSVKIK